MTTSIYNPEELKRRRCDNSRRYRQKINFAHKVKQQSLKQSRMNKHIMNHPYLSINDKIMHHINNSERILSITRKFALGLMAFTSGLPIEEMLNWNSYSNEVFGYNDHPDHVSSYDVLFPELSIPTDDLVPESASSKNIDDDIPPLTPKSTNVEFECLPTWS